METRTLNTRVDLRPLMLQPKWNPGQKGRVGLPTQDIFLQRAWPRCLYRFLGGGGARHHQSGNLVTYRRFDSGSSMNDMPRNRCVQLNRAPFSFQWGSQRLSRYSLLMTPRYQQTKRIPNDHDLKISYTQVGERLFGVSYSRHVFMPSRQSNTYSSIVSTTRYIFFASRRQEVEVS